MRISVTEPQIAPDLHKKIAPQRRPSWNRSYYSMGQAKNAEKNKKSI